MNLRKKLLNSPKPKHQFHDKSSIQWIINNKPQNLPNKYFLNIKPIKKVENLKPWKVIKSSWFQNNLIKNGIHGFRHCCRVAIYSLFLTQKYYKEIKKDKEIESIMFASLIHDCRRKNDNNDFFHGERSANWLKKNKNILPKRLKNFLNLIIFLVSNHDKPYKDVKNDFFYKEFKNFLDIIKTADALDRYRFPRSDWWINLKIVPIKPPKSFMSFAFDFCVKSEEVFIKKNNNLKSITITWEKLKRRLY